MTCWQQLLDVTEEKSNFGKLGDSEEGKKGRRKTGSGKDRTLG